MDLFGGGEDLRQRQRQLSVSGQLQAAASGDARGGSAPDKKPAARKKGLFTRQAKPEGPNTAAGAAAGAPIPSSSSSQHHHQSPHLQQGYSGPRRPAPSPNVQGRGGQGPSSRGDMEAMSVLMCRNSASTAATVRATVHQLAETLTTFGR